MHFFIITVNLLVVLEKINNSNWSLVGNFKPSFHYIYFKEKPYHRRRKNMPTGNHSTPPSELTLALKTKKSKMYLFFVCFFCVFLNQNNQYIFSWALCWSSLLGWSFVVVIVVVVFVVVVIITTTHNNLLLQPWPRSCWPAHRMGI